MGMIKTFCEKHGVEYEMFEHSNQARPMYGVGAKGPQAKKAPERIVEDSK